jgi:hypothetical protein
MLDREKKLSLMRFWLFGTMLIVFTATAVYLGGAIGLGLAIFAVPQFWLSLVLSVGLAVVWYYLYRAYLNRTR